MALRLPKIEPIEARALAAAAEAESARLEAELLATEESARTLAARASQHVAATSQRAGELEARAATVRAELAKYESSRAHALAAEVRDLMRTIGTFEAAREYVRALLAAETCARTCERALEAGDSAGAHAALLKMFELAGSVHAELAQREREQVARTPVDPRYTASARARDRARDLIARVRAALASDVARALPSVSADAGAVGGGAAAPASPEGGGGGARATSDADDALATAIDRLLALQLAAMRIGGQEAAADGAGRAAGASALGGRHTEGAGEDEADEPPTPTPLGAAASPAATLADEADAAGGPQLWALEALAAPAVRRFRFHFCAKKPTNRLDRPGWAMAQIVTVARAHEALCRTRVQPLLSGPRASAEARALCARLRVGGAHDAFVSSLVRAHAAKLAAEWPSYGAEEAEVLACALIDELVAFERQLRGPLALPPRLPGPLAHFVRLPGALERWVQLEAGAARARLSGALAEARAWAEAAPAEGSARGGQGHRLGPAHDGGSAGGEGAAGRAGAAAAAAPASYQSDAAWALRPPHGAAELSSLLRSATARCELAPRVAHAAFASHVLSPLAEAYAQEVRTRLARARLSSSVLRRAAALALDAEVEEGMSVLANGAAFGGAVIVELRWQRPWLDLELDAEPHAAARADASGAAAAAALAAERGLAPERAGTRAAARAEAEHRAAGEGGGGEGVAAGDDDDEEEDDNDDGDHHDDDGADSDAATNAKGGAEGEDGDAAPRAARRARRAARRLAAAGAALEGLSAECVDHLVYVCVRVRFLPAAAEYLNARAAPGATEPPAAATDPARRRGSAGARLARDVSPSLCAGLRALSDALRAARTHLAPSLFRRVRRAVAAQVDGALYAQLLCRVPFSAAAVEQMRWDAHALSALLGPSPPARPAAQLRRTADVCRLLSSGGEALVELDSVLRRAQSAHTAAAAAADAADGSAADPGSGGAAAAPARARLGELGVCALGVDDARTLLRNSLALLRDSPPLRPASVLARDGAGASRGFTGAAGATEASSLL